MPSSRRTLRRRKRPREGYIPPLRTGENDAADREVRSVKFVRRGGIHPARATPPHRKRPGWISNPPLQWVFRRAGVRLPVWPVVAGRHVGEGHAPPATPAAPQTPAGGINPSPTNHGGPAANRETANPAPETCGFPGICGTYKMTVGRDALIPPHPAPPRTPAGGINPSPTNHGKARGGPGNRNLCDITNPCRGRCSHRPATPAPP